MTPSLSKSTLFCSVCGHRSPPDGDWEESETTTELGAKLALTCPDCGTTITRRAVERRAVDAPVDAD